MKPFCLILVTLLFSKPASAQCDAGFTYTVSESFVFFYASDSSAGKNHFWYLGNGAKQTTLHPQQQYFPGTYQVKHVVYDSLLQCSDSVMQEITISYEPQCFSNFDYRRSDANPNRISLYLAGWAYGTNVTELTWKINNEIVATGWNVVEYDLLPPAAYAITLIVETASSCTSSFTDTITSFRACDLDADFEHYADTANALSIYFQPAPYDSLLRYYFTIPGSGFPCCQYVTFSEPGNYTVTMIARDSMNGCFDSVTHVIAVKGNAYDSCTAHFKVTERANDQYQLAAISNQPVTQQYWKICNASGACDSLYIVSGEPAPYVFKDTGYYNIWLTITTETGCTREVDSTVLIQDTGGSEGMRLSSYPNPTQHETILYFEMKKAAPVVIAVYSNMGKPVYNATITTVRGKNKVTVPVQSLPKGQYYINILSAERIWKSVFQKL